MSEGEKQANNQPRGSWGWAGRRPPDWADFRGSRGRHGTWPASACARGTSTASRRISLILAGNHVPAWHRTRPGRLGLAVQEHQSQPVTCHAPNPQHPICAVIGCHPQSSQPNATDFLVCYTPSWLNRRPLTWSDSRAGHPKAKPTQPSNCTANQGLSE